MRLAEARAILEAALPLHWEDIDLTLALLLENGIEADEDILTTPALKAAAFLQSCPNGLAWLDLDRRYPERKQRRERISKYCCFEMFSAVTTPNHLIHISTELGRDSETYWLLNGEISIRFCPWCGKKLPKQPFEEPK